jgi:nucleoside-diphosphate-sugar epimerase
VRRTWACAVSGVRARHGCGGFIGSTCQRLLADGRRVVGLDSFGPFYAPARRRNLRAAEVTATSADRGDVPDPAVRRVQAGPATPWSTWRRSPACGRTRRPPGTPT